MRVLRASFLLAGLVAVLTGSPTPLNAQVAESTTVPDWAATVAREEPPPLRVAERFGVEPLAVLAEASIGARDQLEALQAWNQAGKLPTRVGFSRPLPLPHLVRLEPSELRSSVGGYRGGVLGQSGPSTFVWGTEVRVEEAFQLRLHLSDVRLPESARLWVYGEKGDVAGPFGKELVHDGALWTPSVSGPAIRLEMEVPESSPSASPPSFVIDSVLELVRLEGDEHSLSGLPKGSTDTSCLIDATCVKPSDFPGIDPVRKAIGQMLTISGQFAGVCSGALLNDLDDSTIIPFFLTANHCLDTQAEASSLEVFWDYRTAACGGNFPDPTTKPRTSGATLLATGVSSDFTLLRLNPIPAGRELLGWDARPSAVSNGTVVHRVSHPAPLFPDVYAFPQAYSRHMLAPSRFQCGVDEDGRDWDDPTKILSSTTPAGGTYGGSSGAPLVLPSGQVVGQLLGACGSNPADGCDAVHNDTRDGAFMATFQQISSFLQGGGGPPPPPSGPWLSSSALPGFEAKVRIGGSTIGAKENQCIVESLCVSGALAGRPEIFIKVIGPRPNGFLWAQLSRFTPSAIEIWLRQTSTGQMNFYELEAVGPGSDNVSGLQDRQAFSP